MADNNTSDSFSWPDTGDSAGKGLSEAFDSTDSAGPVAEPVESPLATKNTPGSAAAAFPDGDTTDTSETGFPGDNATFESQPAPTVQSAPVHLLLPSLILGIAAIVTCAYLDFGPHTATDQAYKTFSTIAWFVSGIIGVSLVGVYFIADNRRRAESFYSYIGWKTALYWLTCAALTGGVLWSAIDIAQWVGKL
ncbi:hypothetical protein [Corynebacterium aquilae]|uniref:hypothetical protein n=1 Tax=Corynebacterium aquilae TaxID=203263 RepID=UPI000A048BE9|nr:hypothetical protein [Corynebacterium aquilae]